MTYISIYHSNKMITSSLQKSNTSDFKTSDFKTLGDHTAAVWDLLIP